MNKSVKTILQLVAGAAAMAGVGALLGRKEKADEAELQEGEVVLDADLLEDEDDVDEDDSED